MKVLDNECRVLLKNCVHSLHNKSAFIGSIPVRGACERFGGVTLRETGKDLEPS